MPREYTPLSLRRVLSPDQILLGAKAVVGISDGFLVYTTANILKFKYKTGTNERHFEHVKTFKTSIDHAIQTLLYYPEFDAILLITKDSSDHIFQMFLNSNLVQLENYPKLKYNTHFSKLLNSADSIVGCVYTEANYWSEALLTFRTAMPCFYHPDFKNSYFQHEFYGIYLVTRKSFELDDHRKKLFTIDDIYITPLSKIIAVEETYFVYIELCTFNLKTASPSTTSSAKLDAIITATHQCLDDRKQFIVATENHMIYRVTTKDPFTIPEVTPITDSPVSITIESICETKHHLYFSSARSGFLVYHKQSATLSYLRSTTQSISELNLALHVTNIFKSPSNAWVTIRNDGENTVISIDKVPLKIEKTTSFISPKYQFYHSLNSTQTSPSITWFDSSIQYKNKMISITIPKLESIELPIDLPFIPTSIKIMKSARKIIDFVLYNNHHIATCRFLKNSNKLKIFNIALWENDDYIQDLEPIGNISESSVYILTITGTLYHFNIANNRAVNHVLSNTSAIQIFRIADIYVTFTSNQMKVIDYNNTKQQKSVYLFASTITNIAKLSADLIFVQTNAEFYLIQHSRDNNAFEIPVKGIVQDYNFFQNFILVHTKSSLYMINNSDFKIQSQLLLSPIENVQVDEDRSLIFVATDASLYILEYNNTDDSLAQKYCASLESVSRESTYSDFRVNHLNATLMFDTTTFNYLTYEAGTLQFIQPYDSFEIITCDDYSYMVYIGVNYALNVFDYSPLLKEPLSLRYKMKPVVSVFTHDEKYMLFQKNQTVFIMDFKSLSRRTLVKLEKLDLIVWINEQLIDWDSNLNHLKKNEKGCIFKCLTSGRLVEYHI